MAAESKTKEAINTASAISPTSAPRMSAWGRFWRRRQFLVDPKLQFSIVGLVLFSNLLFVCALAASLFVPLAIAMDSSTHPLAPEARQILALDRKLWPAAALGLIVVSLMSIALSHRIAGPMVRIKSALRAIADRAPCRPVTLREKDFFQDVASLVEDLRRSRNEEAEEITQELRDLARGVDSESAGRIIRLAERLETRDA